MWDKPKKLEIFSKKVYITTTLPYANSKAHVGHALEFIQGDFLSRYFKKQGKKVFFNIGLDEHGQKIWKAAQEKDIEVSEYLDIHYNQWLEFCELYGIEYDNFYRTSDKEHHQKVQKVWKDFVNRGLIYKKKYTGQYCEGCEAFKHDKDLLNGKCPDHPHLEIQTIEEENYFFKLTEFKDKLEEDYLFLRGWWPNEEYFQKSVGKGISGRTHLSPKSKEPELNNLVANIEDISVSRLKTAVPWGVPVPDDEEQTIYVWFDALLNYIFSVDKSEDFCWLEYPLGYDSTNEEFFTTKYIQICGPDNLRFQGVIFQALLSALKLTYTDKILVHGTILDANGQKISKSLGNVIDPIDQVKKFGLDAVRYYTLSLSTFGNANWDEEALVKLYNSHLVNDYGNLIARTLHLIDKKKINVTEPEKDFKDKIDDYLEKAIKSIVNEKKCFSQPKYNIYEYVSKLNEVVKHGNSYINDKEPWKSDDYETTLNNLYYLLSEVTELYEPIIPFTVERVKEALQNKQKAIIFNKIQ